MLKSAVHCIRNLTKTSKEFSFGKNYIIPKAMDPRLMLEIPSIISNTALRTNAVKLKLNF
jgi:malic enzyme